MSYEFVAKNGLISQGNTTVTGSLVTTQNITSSNITASGTGSFGIVGIGTTSPVYSLDVSGNARVGDSLYVTTATTSDASIEIGRGRSGNGNSYVDLIGDATYTDYGLRLIRSNGGANTTSAIAHRGTGTFYITAVEAASISLETSNTTRMTITSAGNVGIGTTNPSTILTISKPIDASAYGSGSRAIDFKLYYPGFDVDSVKASIYVGVSNQGTLQTTKGYLAFLTSATSGSQNLTEKMRIEADGNVGIGTTNPIYKLDLQNTSSTARLGNAIVGAFPVDGNYALFGHNSLNHSSSATNYALLQESNGSTYLNAIGQPIYFRIANTNKMILNSSGQFGIGTTSPITGYLDVRSNQTKSVAGPTNIAFFGSGDGGNPLGLVLNHESSSGVKMVGLVGTEYGSSGNNIKINETLHVQYSGGVGVGTVSPSAKLHISGSSYFQGYANVFVNQINTIGTSGDPGNLQVNSINIHPNSTTETMYIRRLNSGSFQIQTVLASANSGQLHLQPYGGSVGIGTTSPAYLLDVSGSSRHGYRAADNHFFTGSVNISGAVSSGNLTTSTQISTASGTLLSYITPGVYSNGNSTGNSIGIFSNTTFANNGAIANIGLHQSSSNVNDITAKVHLTIGGYYQNSGTGIPIHLGNGYTTDSSPTMTLVPADANGGGFVGIGTTNPGGKLVIIQGDVNARYSTFSSNLGLTIKGNDNSAYNLLTLENTQAAINYGASINFNLGYNGNSTTAGTAVLGARIVGAAEQTWTSTASTQDAYLSFYTTLDGTSGEKVRITSTGNVGIGTTNPTSSLHIKPTAIGADLLILERYASQAKLVYAYEYAADGYLEVRNGSDVAVSKLSGYATTPSYFLSNVGVGTSTPNNRLHVYNSAGSSTTASNAIAVFEQNSNAGIQVCVPDASEAGLFFSRNGAAYYSAVTRNGTDLLLKNGSATAVTINSSRNVGIGTTNPAVPLDVLGNTATVIIRTSTSISSSYSGLRIYNDQNNLFRALEIDYAGSAYAGSLITGAPTGEAATIATTGAYPLVLGTSNTARLTITSGGDVGINTITPGARLDVNGAIKVGTSSANTHQVTGSLSIFPTGSAINFSTTGLPTTTTAKIFVGTTPSPAGSLTTPLVSGYGADDYGLILQAGYASDMGGIKITDDGVVIWGAADEDLFRVVDEDANTLRFLIDGSGNVGIGTTSPGAFFELSSSTASSLLNVKGAGGNGLLYVSGSGNVGIGTTIPTQKLYVKSSTGQDGVMIDSLQYSEIGYKVNGSATKSYLALSSIAGGYLVGSTANAFIIRNDTDIFMTADGGVTSNITIKNSGNIGIGTLNPAAKLEITGSSNSALLNIKSPISGAILYVSGSGAVGIGTSAVGAYTLQVSGSFGATTKSFIIEHPTKEGKKLVYGSLESPYHGIRLTGRDTLIDGKCKVQLPDYIYKLILHDSVNIQLTGIKCNKVLYIDEINVPENYFTIAYDKAVFETYKDYDFFWDFTAIRADVPELETEI